MYYAHTRVCVNKNSVYSRAVLLIYGEKRDSACVCTFKEISIPLQMCTAQHCNIQSNVHALQYIYTTVHV